MGIEVVTAEWRKLEHLVETEANGSIAYSKFSPRGRISMTLVRLACGWGRSSLRNSAASYSKWCSR